MRFFPTLGMFEIRPGNTIKCGDVSGVQSHNPTIARTIDRRVPRLIYDRSQNSTIDRTIDRLWLPLFLRFPTKDHAIDLLQSLLVARPRVRPIVR